MKKMINAFFTLLFLLFGVLLSGCSLLSGPIIENSKKVVTTTDKSGNIIITETDQAPDAISPEIAEMVQACYESFGSDEIDEKYLSRMDSSDIKDILVFKEFRAGLRDASGFDPRQVCATPKTIYDYAIAHDQQLYDTIRHGLSVTGDTAKTLGPWGAVYGVAKRGIANAGSTKIDGETVNINDSLNRPEVHATGSDNTVDYSGTVPQQVVTPEIITVP